ncbi:glycosyl transferase [Leptospira ognonensis]|uniref:Glycosyl transferase n=1 Tax=Leptospira ognonensis TaxID=2484945 RepID=A0A4R9JWK9_9LEPT|nr:glycosyltransferase family 39 protein [Leptospira ognonensis]TGL56731.1 glycosyl transferase [Leptospira ognonensis]
MFIGLILFLTSILAMTLSIPDAPFPQGDEIMHIRSIRESLEAGSYALPALSGLPNPYKPPLLFWMGMIFDTIFGVNYLSERLVSFLYGMGTLTLFYIFYLSLSKSVKESKLATLAFGFSFLSLKFFGILMMEGAMVFFTLLYVFLFYKSKIEKNITYVAWGSFLVGFGYLLKGPILHVYISIFLLSYLYIKMIRVRKGKLHISFSYIKEERLTLSLFSLSLIIPLSWICYLYFYSTAGKELLRFFFMTENMGKFYGANQSGLRIWGGWLLYSAPFSIPIILQIWQTVRKKSNHRNQLFTSGFLVFLLFVTIFHLLPNRKDPYYVTPFIPFLFLLPALSNATWETVILSKINRMSILMPYTLILVIAIVLRLPALFGFSLIAIFFTLGFLFQNQKVNANFYQIFLPQLLIVPITMLFLIRPMADPDTAEQLSGLVQKEVCVIAENPWTGMDVQNKLMNYHVTFSLPLTYAESCPVSSTLVVFNDLKLSDEWEKIGSWYRWKQHLNLDLLQIVQALLKRDKIDFQTEVSVWKRKEIK